MSCVRPLALAQQYWVVQPLIDVGLDLEEIRSLVFRLGFDAIVDVDQGTASDPMALVADQRVEVRAAWARTIGRMLALDGQ